ncbi:hypothetical protein CAOG_04996 [Capsaspora owczarzaki ATCC 30864]|uniref:UspA domain-containing protein n=1 Tax=Capsaspora owczarzaki (strain ATCC 30864) TaxID=595528 RepID=A0A0D2VT07_CAPO3|nr:hypothetical protein CAOG_04996 [Capsaspora owczarzaki ATCC 30864]KJE94337.1 hypothetical protein CAOG_004996 [Capsaspora owczarzaki ATCC 30864]|eukprot:XP_004346681.1 hypothetical protein CAOG_04996 [Capsaspora owczarzaki ATCC 30864]
MAAEPRYILVPVDDSVGARRAFDMCLNEIVKPGDGVFLVHVYEPFMPIVTPTGYVPPELFENFSSRGLKEAERILSALAAVCAERGIPCKTQAIEGDARDSICTLADTINAKMIVIGSRGLGAIKRALLGSVSSFVVNHSSKPVLVVHGQ